MNMRLNLTCIILLFIVLFFLSCANKSELPKGKPNNLEIKLNTTEVGERYPSPNIPGQSLVRWLVISGNEISYERVRCEGIIKITVSDGEINRIYDAFVENEFDLIENGKTSEVTQKGFRELHLRAANISKSVKLGEEFTLSEKDEKRFRRIWTNLADLIEQKVEFCNSR